MDIWRSDPVKFEGKRWTPARDSSEVITGSAVVRDGGLDVGHFFIAPNPRPLPANVEGLHSC